MARFRTVMALILTASSVGCFVTAGPATSARIADQAILMARPEVEPALIGIGYAVVSVQDHGNAEQQRLLAMRSSKLDAYRSLAEQVYGQYVDSSTTIADLTMTNDRFRARVEGVIFGARLVSIEPVGEDSYQTTLALDAAVVSDLRALYLQHFINAGGR